MANKKAWERYRAARVAELAALNLRYLEGRRTSREPCVIPDRYRRKTIACNACERQFDSYDPRYNRRCETCQRRVDNGVIDLRDVYESPPS